MPIDPTSTGSITQHDAALAQAAGAPPAPPLPASLVCTAASPWLFLSSFKLSAAQALGTRVIMPKSGILHDFSILTNALTTGGNVDVGIYSLVAEPRARLWHSGSQPISATLGWQIIGDPALAVNQGDVLDFIFSLDTSNSLDAGGIFSKDVYQGQLPSAAFWPVGCGSSYITYTVNSGAFPLPTTITDANCHRATFIPCLMARIV